MRTNLVCGPNASENEMIGEPISPTIDMDDVVTAPGGLVYANKIDKTLNRPLDIARYFYVRAVWSFGAINRVKKIEVWHNHAQAICFLSVDYLTDAYGLAWTDLPEPRVCSCGWKFDSDQNHAMAHQAQDDDTIQIEKISNHGERSPTPGDRQYAADPDARFGV